MQFPKLPLIISDQINLLKARGLNFPDEDRAKKYLSNISYYRLSAYSLPFQVHGDTNHTFIPNIEFDQILELYLFDRELRLIIFDAIERTEIALRTQIINQFCTAYGAHWFEDPIHFHNNYKYSKNLAKLDEEIDRSSEVFIKHYKNKYTNPARPPVWMCFEIASMGLLSKIYSDLKMSQAKKNVAFHFKLGHPNVLESWMLSISYVRNICAHHSRIWNRVLTLKPMLPNITGNIWLVNRNIQGNKLYAFLCILLYMRKVVNPNSSFAVKIKSLLHKYPNVDPTRMGFPIDWDNEPIWK
jgi:abortive infection bacteriophage resistance protein